MIWFVLAALVVVAIVLATWTVWRRPRGEADAERRLAIYRRQIAEIDDEAERGVIRVEDARAARLEVERRLLRAADTGGAVDRPVSTAAVVMVAVIAIFAAVWLYLELGSPGQQGSPHQSPGRERVSGDADGPTLNALVDQLIAHLEGDPEALEGWAHLRRAAPALGRQTDWARALERAVAARPDNPELRVLYAESLVALGKGTVTPAARLAIDRAAAMAPDHPVLRYYQAQALAQAGRHGEAEAIWRALLAEAPGDGPWAQQLRVRIAEMERRQGKVPEGASDAAAAIMALPAGEQAAQIRAMVDGLAARLEAEPDDRDGWLRLARAYVVLGEADVARTAYGRAADLARDAGDADAADAIAAEAAERLP